MAISSINRNVVTQDLTASGNINVDSDQVLCDCTSGAITATLYTVSDGAFHQVIVEKTDSGGNAVTVTDGTFTFSLSAQYDAVICQTQDDGTWFGVSGFDRSGTGDVEGPSSATSGNIATFSGTTGKVIQDSAVAIGAIAIAASEAVSAGSAGAVALSAATSGTTLATSEATSAGNAGAVALSAATSGTTLATSEATSAGAAGAEALSAAISAGAAASVALSTAAST